MKWGIWLILLLIIERGYSQRYVGNFKSIDWKVRSIESDSPEALAQQLTASYTSDLEKVRAIFSWITENISYQVKERYRTGRYTFSNNKVEETIDTAELKPVNERVAETVLKKKAAVCDGYARLFKTLCDFAGIRSEIITGYARTNTGVRFQSNHSWNAVLIDSTWRLLDATWASGYTNFSGDEFIKFYNDYYFLTPPEFFIRDHFPDDLQWTLLPDPPVLREFRNSPFKQRSFIKYNITSVRPSDGIIDASIGDTIRFTLQTRDAARDSRIATDSLFDSLIISPPISWAFVTPDHLQEEATLNTKLSHKRFTESKTINYTYIVGSYEKQWLHLMYNNDVIIRYKLNVREILTNTE